VQHSHSTGELAHARTGNGASSSGQEPQQHGEAQVVPSRGVRSPPNLAALLRGLNGSAKAASPATRTPDRTPSDAGALLQLSLACLGTEMTCLSARCCRVCMQPVGHSDEVVVPAEPAAMPGIVAVHGPGGRIGGKGS
jgi:hypothetical protein